ncbi:hypothetical protein Wcon_00169 [Wolbachia endosymbiont of Cylisticus convexus]|uniref:hypothetical protein n=1 Tax=Wolbachia endosymbiont of Cylisticus convexus TaxID=118728 RepID=UPI000DF6E493|nr:hypothetical protein [Wolbachia endosymbiont of Cylisticus convexus]RDD35656.1 hypothetical protein Wcon_00169 [Wolbachia endosymbiont of Cylisticus convexus]
MILKKLQDIKKELEESIQSKSIIKLPVSGNLVNDIRESLELIKKHPDQEKNITEELINLYEKLIAAGFIVQHDCWDSFKRSSADSKPLSDKYNFAIAYGNLNIVVEGLSLLYNDELYKTIIDSSRDKLLDNFISLQKEMKEALEKMQQQDAARQKELEKKIEEEFSKCIESGTIDEVSITKYGDQNLLYAIIKLKEDNKSTDIKVSEFLNSDFCKKNSIAAFWVLNGSQERIIYGKIDEKGVRYYYLGTTDQYRIKFNWYIDERKCSITLSANSDGTIKIVSDKPDNKDLEENKDVKIKVGNTYLSLADAVKTCKQNSQQSDEVSSKLSQSSANEHFRPLVKAPASCF